MWIGWTEFDILLGDVHSLKEKRSVVRPLLAEVKRRYDVSVAEVGDHEQYRRARIGAGLVAADRAHLVEDFTTSTRKEAGNLWFEWSRSVEDPNEFVLVEAFKDDAAGDHVNSAHFKKAMEEMPQALAETPRIISRQLDGEGWDAMGELTI